MTTLAELRKNRAALASKISEAQEKPESQREDDSRFWQPTRDSAGNGSAIIRFLPNGLELPFVTVYSRSFKHPVTNKWYINEDLSTIGRTDDPVYVYINENNLYETNKDLASKMGRKTHYISNILIISDPAKPELNGQVKLFKYGKKIYEKIKEQGKPTFADQAKVDIFDIDTGANFRLRVKEVEGYPNYDSSVFDSPSALCSGDEDEMSRVISSTFDISEFVDPKNKRFKTPEALKRELDRALGVTGSRPVGTASGDIGGGKSEEPKIPTRNEKKSEPVKAPWDDAPAPEKASNEKSTSGGSSGGDDDDDMAFFQSVLKK